MRVWTLFLMLIALPLWAGPNDLQLQKLVQDDGTGQLQLRQDDFALLTTELGLILTPSPLRPAETTGQSGFDLGIDYGLHVISFDRAFWQDSLTQAPGPVQQTIGIRGRKGFVFPVPLTSEIELDANWLVDSSVVSLGGLARVALNEGFAWIPDASISLGLNRVLGAGPLDLTTITAGASVSKGFGVAGDFHLVPFLNYQSIFINAQSRLIDLSPDTSGDLANYQRFDPIYAANVPFVSDTPFSLDTLNRYDRISVGIRAQVAIVALTIGTDFNLIPENGEIRLMSQTGVRASLIF